ncbi:MAG: helix-turn-helix transcriptional regulator [Clostridia bacterium]|nr:helix-turn-helix transcriptional regulator [Clostridia bacterium]
MENGRDITPMQELDVVISEILLVHRNRFVRSFGYNDYRGGRRFDGLVFCVSGEGRFDFEDGTVCLESGEMMFLSSKSAYCVKNNNSAPFVHYTVNFKISDYFPKEATVFSDILSGRKRYKTTAEEGERIGAELESLLAEWQGKRTGYLLRVRSAIYRMLGEYLNAAGRSLRERSMYSRLRPAKKALDHEYRRERPISELASLCGMSEAHFRRSWKCEFGASPLEYHKKRRLARARELLASGFYTVKAAASEVGYDDANYFSRIFRAEFGISPREFMDDEESGEAVAAARERR